MQLYESSDEYFEKQTGKSFSEWKSLLDEWNGLEKGHTEMCIYLQESKGLDPEWAEAVAVRYQKEAYM